MLLEKKRFVAMEYLCSRYIRIKHWRTLIAKMRFIDDMHPFVACLDKWLLNNYDSVDDFDNEGAMMNFIGYLANIQIDLDTLKPLMESLFHILEDLITSRLVNQKIKK